MLGRRTFGSIFVWMGCALAGSALAQQPGIAECGLPAPAVACTRLSRNCVPYKAEVADYWHGMAQCLRKLRDSWAASGPGAEILITQAGYRRPVADFARDMVVASLRRKEVRLVARSGPRAQQVAFDEAFDTDLKLRKPFDDAFVANDLGTPYNGMGQTDMAYMAFQLGALAAKGGYPRSATDEAFYRKVGESALATVLRPVGEGGLASYQTCAGDAAKRCAWFHSITRRDKQVTDGLTLNQNLHVIRDLGLIADIYKSAGWGDSGPFETAMTMGMNQLFQTLPTAASHRPPLLSDFLGPPVGAHGVRWFYYGYGYGSKSKAAGGYFLNEHGKDCNYHVHVIDLLNQIIAHKAGLPGSSVPSEVRACGTVLSEAVRTAQERFYNKDVGAWSAGPMDTACKKGVAGDYAALNKQPLIVELKSCAAAPR